MSATADLLADADVVLTCGAGGVGKTTVAAAFARRAAEQGRNVALVTVGVAVLWSFGLMGWLGIPLDSSSSNRPTWSRAIGGNERT